MGSISLDACLHKSLLSKKRHACKERDKEVVAMIDKDCLPIVLQKGRDGPIQDQLSNQTSGSPLSSLATLL